MLVVNEIARSPYTDPITIKTQEEAPTEAPSGIQIVAVNPGELIVTWQIPPRNSWNGELLGYNVSYAEDKQGMNNINSNRTAVSNVITVHGWATSKSIITSLRKFTKYIIRVRAFNTIAEGPWSSTFTATTLEGVPEAPPNDLNCTSLSSQSIKVSWQEPSPQFHGGIIQGYKVLYRPLTKYGELDKKREEYFIILNDLLYSSEDKYFPSPPKNKLFFYYCCKFQ
jgi:Down syndrome cell adhesion molecule